MVTYEEEYALGLVCETAFKPGHDPTGTSLWLCSVSRALPGGARNRCVPGD